MIVHLALAFRPMLRATRADKDESHTVLGWLREVDSLVVAAMLAVNILTSLQCGVFDALWVDLQVFSSHGVVSLVDAVVGLAELTSALIVVTKLALEQEEATLITAVLLGVEHVVTLGAEPHSLERVFRLVAHSILGHVLLRHHSSCLHRQFVLQFNITIFII